MNNSRTQKIYILVGICVLIIFALTLYFMGQVWICKCGYVKLWHGVTVSSENSQHITDWYTFSHIIHGFAFYWFLKILSRRWRWLEPLGIRLLLAMVLEVSWEIFENTDYVINRYREVTISRDYYGDSIINSVGDVFFMILGFVLAWRLPIWVIITAIIGLELFVGYFIHDNLALNVIMLIYPLDFILKWQGSG